MSSDHWFASEINDTIIWICEHLEVEIPPVGSIEQARKTDIFQIMGFYPESLDSHLHENIFEESTSTRWHPLFTDIVNKNNNKSEGVIKTLDHHGFGHDTSMAFGDGGNDISMLKTAAIGVAMGNANDEVKDAADYITTSVDEDGIQNALRHFGLIE